MEEERKKGRKPSEPIPEERLREIRMKLWEYKLNYSWLIRELYRNGVQTCKEDLSMYLCGRRKGEKAELVIDTAFAILEKYARTYC